MLPPPDRLVPVGTDRVIALDDRGDDAGRPVLYVHGTPDSRLARHPDDSIATRLGVRLLCPDRPGIGDSTPDPTATPESVADDLVRVLDVLDVREVGVLAWSAGAIFATALAGRHPERVTRLVLASPLVPADAYRESGVLAGADDARAMFADVLPTMSADEIGAEMAMWLVPPEVDAELAAEMLTESLESVAGVPGAGASLVAALQASVASGSTGVERDLAAQATPLAGLLDRVRAEVSVHVGTDDHVTPVPMAEWYGRRLGARVEVHRGIGHALPILRWPELLGELGRAGGRAS